MYENDPFRSRWTTNTSPWEPREGEGDVTFTLTDDSTFTIKGVRVDSIGPGASNKGVVSVEFFDNDNVVHVPFVKFWTISYDAPPF